MSHTTEKLFFVDPYLRTFEAHIVEVQPLAQGFGVILDKTAFYPEAGGQPCDQGKLQGHPVRQVFEENGMIVHVVENPFQKGEKITGEIDCEIRFDHMQQHSGQHLLSQTFLRLLNAETIGFHLGKEEVTIDLNILNLSLENVEKVENQANQVVWENRAIRSYEKSPSELNTLPLRKLPELSETIRIVEIEDYDWSCCCGTHVQSTGEIGLIKILKWEKYKGGMRVYFVCGNRALRDYRKKMHLLKSTSLLFTVGEEELPTRLEQWKNERKSLEKKLETTRKRLIEAEKEAWLSKAKTIPYGQLIFALFENRDIEEIPLLARKLIQQSKTIVLMGENTSKKLWMGCSNDTGLDLRHFQNICAEKYQAKGGGGPCWMQWTFDHGEMFQKAFQELLSRVESMEIGKENA